MKVFYDGLCKVCDKEIDIYKKKDREHKIEFVDISSPSFSAEKEQLQAKQVQKIFHVKNRNGLLLTGVDGFVAIWEELDIFRPLRALAEFKLTRPLFDLGYTVFTVIRPLLPRKECADGYCQTS